jgi:hypothetical protein
MNEAQALAGIKSFEEELRQLTNQPQPCLKFSGSLQTGTEASKTIWKISAVASRTVRTMPERMRESCEAVGFHVLSNHEPEAVLHLVVRGRWKNSGIDPPSPTTSCPMSITFDKVGFTRRDVPVEDQKYFREACGETLCMNFGTNHIYDRPSIRIEGFKIWGTQEAASASSDISTWPPLPSTAKDPQLPKSSTRSEVIMHDLQHPDPPTPVEPSADQRLAAALQSTGRCYGGQAVCQLSGASFNRDQMEMLPGNQQDGASQMSRLSAQSRTSDGSWISGASAGPRCFLPQTLFKIYAPGTVTETFVRASELAKGVHVESAEG